MERAHVLRTTAAPAGFPSGSTAGEEPHVAVPVVGAAGLHLAPRGVARVEVGVGRAREFERLFAATPRVQTTAVHPDPGGIERAIEARGASE